MSTRKITDFSLPTTTSITFRLELMTLDESLRTDAAISEAILNLHVFFRQYRDELNQITGLADYFIEIMFSKNLNSEQLALVNRIRESLKLPKARHEAMSPPDNLWERPPNIEDHMTQAVVLPSSSKIEPLEAESKRSFDINLAKLNARKLEIKARIITKEAQECQ
ncbi:MAG: hypothetical protein HZB76_05135, partial [Chlamydiae bacterium]|nr:hypothetical protein [Chlamydiota bacterium]